MERLSGASFNRRNELDRRGLGASAHVVEEHAVATPTVAISAAAFAVAILLTLGWICLRGGSTDTSDRYFHPGGVLRIGYAIEAPYAFLTPDGRVTGESPEIARDIAVRLGIGRVEWRLTEFSMLIEGLESRRFDMIAAGMFVTEERKRRVAFSHTTFQARSAMLVLEGNPKRLSSYEASAADPGIRIAVISGSVEEEELLRFGVRTDQLIRVPDALTGRSLVKAGKVDGLALSAPTVRWMAHTGEPPRLECVEVVGSAADRWMLRPPGAGAFAFRRSEKKLLAAWNHELLAYLGGERHRQWMSHFHFRPEELPGSTPPLTVPATH
ncbi:MAG: transporter substrate-binding domain-containing protein [Verrucomicrobiales bacterium]|nr:transporter substrate-binding domain-containing protein [Verrucomicrobiales bacterium]